MEPGDNGFGFFPTTGLVGEAGGFRPNCISMGDVATALCVAGMVLGTKDAARPAMARNDNMTSERK